MRRCPSCGRHFSVELTSKKVLSVEDDTERVMHDIIVRAPRGQVLGPIVTYEDVPIERESIEIGYECRHCHHQWKETIIKIQKGWR
ncbi:MAG: hypothetical protein HY247_03930 [archaeon]|nr:MAG: hypothetical protein HY247_03930 [archaeon]